jgi:hypothetical protein
VQPVTFVASPTNVVLVFPLKRVASLKMKNPENKDWFRAFLDFFVLFSGISTASNLARTQGRKLMTRGIFLFRSKKESAPPDQPVS